MHIFHTPIECNGHQWTWGKAVKTPFDELIISWNGFRPTVGFWEFSVSLFQNGWSPWIKYAEWGAGRQKTFNAEGSFVTAHQDVIRPKNGCCSAFRIEILAKEGADLTELHSITATLTDTSLSVNTSLPFLPSTHLSWIPHQSQQILPHPRCKDLCSPTSTSSAINYLFKTKTIDPTLFAEAVRDQHFDIYGNWILNTAAAYEALQGKYRTYVARMHSFAAVHAQIEKGLPVVLSIKGPLQDAPLPYAQGHLLLLTGYDHERQRVHCMDPGFPTDSQTNTSYELGHFLEAWGRRRNLAYLFERT